MSQQQQQPSTSTSTQGSTSTVGVNSTSASGSGPAPPASVRSLSVYTDLDGREKRRDLQIKPRYLNTLPEIPMEPKFLSCSGWQRNFHKYFCTSLETNLEREVHYEPHFEHGLDLVDARRYDLKPDMVPDEKDENIFDGDENLFSTLDMNKLSQRSKSHAKNVSWLRRTEYISTEQMRFRSQALDNMESKVGFLLKKKAKANLFTDLQYMGKEDRVKAIEKTFEDSKKPITAHFSKPGVHAVETLPIYPDFQSWKYSAAQVIFDADPAPDIPKEKQEETMKDGLIRGVQCGSGEQFVAYFLPTEETMEKRKADEKAGREYKEDETYDYKMAREYTWVFKLKGARGFDLQHVFVERDDGVFYNEIDTKVQLAKRRVTVGRRRESENTMLCVKHIPLERSDYEHQAHREKQLEAREYSDDEDETNLDGHDSDRGKSTPSQLFDNSQAFSSPAPTAVVKPEPDARNTEDMNTNSPGLISDSGTEIEDDRRQVKEERSGE